VAVDGLQSVASALHQQCRSLKGSQVGAFEARDAVDVIRKFTKDRESRVPAEARDRSVTTRDGGYHAVIFLVRECVDVAVVNVVSQEAMLRAILDVAYAARGAHY